jgi:hypothetical protein
LWYLLLCSLEICLQIGPTTDPEQPLRRLFEAAKAAYFNIDIPIASVKTLGGAIRRVRSEVKTVVAFY